MIKSTNLDLPYLQTHLKKSIKSKWILLLILFPLAVYGVYLYTEPQLVLAVSKVFPPESDKSIEFYRDFVSLIFNELLWISGFLLVTWIFVVYVPLTAVTDKLRNVIAVRHRLYASIIISVSFVASLVVSVYTLETFPNSSDEYAYLYQAHTLGKGRLWENAHPHPEFFHFNHIAQKEGISIGRFPPGWPILLSTAYALGFPAWLVNPLLGLLTMIVFYSFALRFYDREVAIWSLAAMAFCGFFIFNSASYFSHTSCALFTVSFIYCGFLYIHKLKPVHALLAGFLLGMIAITRYYTAVIICIPFAAYFIYQLRLRSVVGFVWLGLGGLPCVAFLFWYNNAVTGNPLVPVTIWAYADEALGFVRGHSVTKGMEHIVRWSFMFMYWCSPGLLVLYFIALYRKIVNIETRWAHPEYYFFILLMAGYFFYYQIGGNQYGPRFFFEAFPFLVLFVADWVFRSRDRLVLAVFFSSLLFAVVKFPSIAAREHQVISERKDVYKLADEHGLSNAVVFLDAPTSVIRPMPKGDLTRNYFDYNADVLYALDLDEKNEVLMNYYPDRTFYRYIRDTREVRGALVRVESVDKRQLTVDKVR